MTFQILVWTKETKEFQRLISGKQQERLAGTARMIMEFPAVFPEIGLRNFFDLVLYA
jgi:hypothetical protein